MTQSSHRAFVQTLRIDDAPTSPPLTEPFSARPGAFLAPPVGRRHIVRHRIDALLDDAIEASLVLVSAPAGSGKSTALSSWLARRDGTNGWYSLESDANDPAVFWPSLAATIGLPGAADMAGPRDVARCLFAEGHPMAGRPIVVVLDDYHAIVNPAIHAGMDQLLVEAPARLRVVVSTRHDPPLMLARLRAQASLREIRFDDLRFGDAEVSALLNEHLGGGLAESDVGRLTERTEGWAAGVQLVALSLQNRTDRAAFIDQLAGDDRHISDYLRDEVLARLPEPLRRFLVDTAILDQLTAPLCEAVAGVAAAQSMLEELDRRNLFIIPLDHRRQWFRYHHLFAEWLRLQAGGDVHARHRRAADWLADHHMPGDAIGHYVAARDPDRGAEVIDRERWILVGQGREETLREWTQLLPRDVLRRHPRLTLAAAWVAHRGGRWDDVHRLVESFQATAGHDADADADGALLGAEVALLEAGRLIAQGHVTEAARTAEDAIDLVASDEPRARSGLFLVIGRCRLAEGDFEAARRAFEAAINLVVSYKAVGIVHVIARAHLAEIDRLVGRIADAETNSRAVIEFAEQIGLADNPECTVAHLTLGNVLLDLGHVEEATEAIARGTELAGLQPYVARERQAAAANQRLLASPGRRSTRTVTIEPITGREQSVLRLLPTSLTPREIAAELYLSLNTVKTHTRALYRKLDVQTRHAAIEEARRRNLL